MKQIAETEVSGSKPRPKALSERELTAKREVSEQNILNIELNMDIGLGEIPLEGMFWKACGFF